MTFTPTPEQVACVTAARDTPNNLLISALAGAAKTSTLVLIADALPDTRILCLAFNKKIALEMQERLPSNCGAKTLNSLGHAIWGRTLGKRLHLDTDKMYRLLTTHLETLSPEEKSGVYENFTTLRNAISAGKTAGYIPSGHYPTAKALVRDDEFFAWLDEEPTPLEMDIIRAVSAASLAEALKGTIDFDDQILLPSCFPADFDSYPLTLVDEAQDLSLLNHTFLRKLVRNRRLIAVGDPCQAIYGFRGAHEDSMEKLRTEFSMTTLTLSTSFRCPRKVVETARWRAPHMQFPEWAKEGEVRTLGEWKVDDIPNEAAIICRNNAPIFRLALRLLQHGRYPHIMGNDIGKALLKVMEKLGRKEMSAAEALDSLDVWVAEKVAKSRNPSPIYDRAECIRVFLMATNTLGDALAYATHLFETAGPIKLMTGHKSKGLEFDDVFILDRRLIRMDEPGQDRNLMYVMQTRSKSRLTYIDTENFIPSSGEITE